MIRTTTSKHSVAGVSQAQKSRKSSSRKRPTIRPEKEFSSTCGDLVVGGVDEAGRGPLAGPVVAACVVWSFEKRRPPGLGDSKQLSPATRERLFGAIQRSALSWGLGLSHADEIDLINILEATRLASARAVEEASRRLPGGLRIRALVTDALDIPVLGIPIHPIIKGDQKSASIAAASILAKVTRDRLMDGWHKEFPEYGWDRNRGYPTKDHYCALRRHGPTILHRMSFSGVGFFSDAPRRSPSHAHFSMMIEKSSGHPGAIRAIFDEIEQYGSQIPPRDRDDLLQLLSKHG